MSRVRGLGALLGAMLSIAPVGCVGSRNTVAPGGNLKTPPPPRSPRMRWGSGSRTGPSLRIGQSRSPWPLRGERLRDPWKRRIRTEPPCSVLAYRALQVTSPD